MGWNTKQFHPTLYCVFVFLSMRDKTYTMLVKKGHWHWWLGPFTIDQLVPLNLVHDYAWTHPDTRWLFFLLELWISRKHSYPLTDFQKPTKYIVIVETRYSPEGQVSDNFIRPEKMLMDYHEKKAEISVSVTSWEIIMWAQSVQCETLVIRSNFLSGSEI